MSGNGTGKHSPIVAGLLCVAALILALTTAFAIGNLGGQETERRNQRPAAYSEAAQFDARRACAGLPEVELFECIYQRVEAAQEQARGEQDLSAQQRSASSALASTIIATFTLTISALALWFVKATLDATRAAVREAAEGTNAALQAAKAGHIANDIAQDVSNRQLRAYVYPIGFDWGIRTHLPQSGFTMWIRCLWKNFGQTPTRNMRAKVLALISDDDKIPDINIELGPGAGAHFYLGPSQQTRSEAVYVSDTLADQIYKREKHLFIAGIAEYRDALENKLRQTRFCYEFAIFRDGSKPLEGDNINYVEWTMVGNHNGADGEYLDEGASQA